MNAETIKEKLCQNKEGIKELSEKVAAILKREFRSELEFEELVSETALILLEKRGELCQRERLCLSFLVVMVRNRLIDRYLRRKKFQTVSIFHETEENGKSLEEKLEGDPFNIIALLNGEEALELLKNELNDREFEVLCFKVHSALYKREENPFLAGRSRNAKDQAWSRLRPKVERILKKFDFSLEDMEVLSQLILSECFRKFRLSNRPEEK